MTDPTPLRVVKNEAREVAPPGDPLTNAHTFLTDTQELEGHSILAHQQGEWRRWNGRAWPLIDVEALEHQLYGYFHPTWYWKKGGDKPTRTSFNPNRAKVGDLIHAIRAITHIDADLQGPAWLEQPAGAPDADQLIPCINGLLDMNTRRLHDHTPAFFNYQTLPFAYDADADEPLQWRGFLRSLWPDDPDAISCLQEMFGYILSGATDLQKGFFLIGPKRSGKGTIARILTALMGPDDVAGPTMGAFASNFGLSPLIGRRLAIVGDARLRANDDDVIQRLLSITGEDTIEVDRKHRDPWTGRLPSRLLLLSNELPSLFDASGALASRFILLRLTRSFYGQEDTSLEQTLLAELPGILNWALDGLDRLRERGHLHMPDSSLELVREMEDLGSPISAFVRERCVVLEGAQVATDLMFDAWRSWCREQGRDHIGTVQTFGRDLRAAVPEVSTSRPRASMGPRRRVYENIGLAAEMPDADAPDPEPVQSTLTDVPL